MRLLRGNWNCLLPFSNIARKNKKCITLSHSLKQNNRIWLLRCFSANSANFVTIFPLGQKRNTNQLRVILFSGKLATDETNASYLYSWLPIPVQEYFILWKFQAKRNWIINESNWDNSCVVKKPGRFWIMKIIENL